MPERFRLSNGLTVVFEEQHAAPVAAFQIWIRAGGSDEREDQAGLAHLHEHMLFKGSSKRGPGELARDLEARGGEVNAWTSFDETVYHVVLASRFAREGLEALCDAVRTPTFDPDELSREIEVVCEEIKRSEDSPARRASRQLFSNAFHAHPYGKPVLGTEASVRSFDAARMREFYEAHYVPENMVLSAAGDLTLSELREWAESFLGGDWGRRPPQPRERPPEPARDGVRVALRRDDVREAWLHLSFPAPPFLHPDAAALDLLSMISGQGDTSRLVREVKRDAALVNEIHLSAFTPRDPGLLICSMTLPPENAAAALEKTASVLASLGEAPPSVDDLETVRSLVESEAIYQRETAQGMARKLGFYEADAGDMELEARYYAQIAAVTPEQVQDVARRYLRLDRALVTGLLPEGSTLDEAQVRTILAAARPAADRPAPTRAREPMRGGLHVLSGSARTTPKPMQRHRLSSGATLFIREERAVPLVAVRAVALGGLRYETPEQNGLTTLLARTITRGAGELDAEAFADAFDRLSGSVGATAGRSSFSLRGDFLARHFARSFELFASCITAPHLAATEFEQERRLLLQDIHTRADKPTQIAFDLFGKALWKAHPYRLHPHGEEESVSALTTQALRDHHARWLRPEQLTLAIVGDVDAEQVLELAERFLPARPGRAAEAMHIPIEGGPSAPIEVRHPLARAQSQLVLGYRGARVGSPWRHALDVLVTVLSGQGGRLFTELRDKRSLAYSVGAFAMQGVDPGYLAIYMGTSPEKVDGALAGIREELRRICEEPITQAELTRAREKLLGTHDIGLQRNGARASVIALDHAYGLGAENFLHFAEQVNAVDAAAVQAVARSVIRDQHEVLAIVGP